ncbi:MAG: alpha-hydroxy-acid oxidizing protein [Deltaproteobacteria bacterium]|nr:alpha-hydroxy-acid oxidizing protein [Deltaproteobacteria bacterium]
MPRKFHVHTREMEPRFPPISKYSRIELDGCLGCLRCAKREACLYEVYEKKSFDPDLIVDTGDDMCVSCLRCLQECKKNILTRATNPRFREMGDDHWTPDIIAQTWKQARTGKIPVSGAGYRGPFVGAGFDQMWTDMSEIVRPTRDGIHGREYISTVIELGRRPAMLEFDEAGRLTTEMPPFVEIALPVILDIPRKGIPSPGARRAMVAAAGRLETLAVATAAEASSDLADAASHLIVKPDAGGSAQGAPVVEVPDSPDAPASAKRLREQNPGVVVSVRLDLDENAAKRASALAAGGIGVIHLQADDRGRGLGERSDDFLTGLVREVHGRLVEDAVRDQVTLLVSGGIAMAEHVAKTIICGADGVGVDLALLVALECRLCRECSEDSGCEVALENVPPEWAEQRIVNLLGSWHSQLIEVMGAMGLREARRLRGEVGRAMFFEDLERDSFAPFFGERVEEGTGTEVVEKEAPDAEAGTFEAAEPARACPSRFRNMVGRYRVVRTTACVACGTCAGVCTEGVHRKAGSRMLAPVSKLCLGADRCREKDAYCADACPEGALVVGPDPVWDTFGDPRWTPDLICATWEQAETGRPPTRGLEHRTGDSGGGFDRISLSFPDAPPDASLTPSDVDLSLELNNRGDGRPTIRIGFPVYGGGMSYGSVSLTTMVARARAYKAFDSFTCTGEGGYPEPLKEYDDNVITQVATGLFGVLEETIQRVRIVEFKYAQGAKPGLGGHLLGDKVTPAVAEMREAVVGSALFSPFPFHSVYSVEDHKKHVDWIRHTNPRALVSVKVSTPTDVDMVAVGSYHAGAHIIHIDGSYGGTGAAPDIAKKNIAMPIEYAIPKVHRFMVEEGIRDEMTLIASGGLRSAWDVAKAIALGADGVVIGTPEMVALECVRCGVCERGRGCPRGIATTDPQVSELYGPDWAAQRLINLYHSWCIQLREILWRLGMRSVQELRGRSDVLVHHDYRPGNEP